MPSNFSARRKQAGEEGDLERAIKIYKRMVKHYPHSNTRPEATFRAAKLTEEKGDLRQGRGIYRGVDGDLSRRRQHFQEAIESQFRIGELYSTGRRKKFSACQSASTMDDAVEMFAAIVRARLTAVIRRGRSSISAGRARNKAPPTWRSTPTNRSWRNSLTIPWRSMPSIRSVTSG